MGHFLQNEKKLRIRSFGRTPNDAIDLWLSNRQDRYWRLPNVLNSGLNNGTFVRKSAFFNENWNKIERNTEGWLRRQIGCNENRNGTITVVAATFFLTFFGRGVRFFATLLLTFSFVFGYFFCIFILPTATRPRIRSWCCRKNEQQQDIERYGKN